MIFFRLKEILDYLAFPLYRALGRRPWSPGYYTAKKATICAGIDHDLFSAKAGLPTGYGYRVDERAVEYPWLFAHLPKGRVRVLDAGSALNHQFLIERPPLRDAQLTIMTLAPEKRCFWDRSISYVFGDLRDTKFADGSFDVVASISTIEHIGLDNTMLYTGDVSKKESDAMGFVPAVTEFRRILASGGLCLITVPYGKHGVHGWYQVFDHEQLMTVVEAFGPSDYSIEYFGYGPNGWHRADAEEVADAEFFDVHAGKPFGQDMAAGARAVACIRLLA